MPELNEDVRLQRLIADRETELEQVKTHQEESARHNIPADEEPGMMSYNLSPHPVPSDRHPAYLRAKRRILEDAVDALKQVRTSDHLVRVYRDLIGRIVPRAEYLSTVCHNNTVMSLQNELRALMDELDINPTPPTQTATQSWRT